MARNNLGQVTVDSPLEEGCFCAIMLNEHEEGGGFCITCGYQERNWIPQEGTRCPGCKRLVMAVSNELPDFSDFK